MKNTDKKLFLFFAFIFCFCAGFAQSKPQILNQIKASPVKKIKPKGEMRIFVKDGEEVITNFETAYLLSAPKIHIIVPQNIAQERRPSLYIISDEEIDKAKIQEKYPAFYDKYVFVTVRVEEEEDNFTPFLTRELLPYVEMNYPVSSKPQERTLIAKNSFALNYLANLEELFEYLQNAVLGFDYSSPLPEIKAQKGLNLWASGPLEDMASLHIRLNQKGLSYLEDFAYVVTKKAQPVGTANLDFLFNKEGRKVVQTVPYQQFKTLDLNNENISSAFWLNLTAKNGYDLSYIPQQMRIAPPFLNWNKEQGLFEIIPGAVTGKIKADGKTEFGKKFKVQFNIIDSANQPQKTAKKQ